MLTSKVGESIINCFDGKYDRYRLKVWSKKGILKCPVCGGDYEYCHGEVVSPYFRHVGKDCEGYYSEPETDEHIKGKKILYEWIKNQNGVSNYKLEAWIPETRQRPDIYFEKDGERYVIEFQCTPIASEFLIRRELYSLNNIKDIWVLGLDKYNLDTQRKTIEKNLQKDSLMYLNVNSGELIFDELKGQDYDSLNNIPYRRYMGLLEYYLKNEETFNDLEFHYNFMASMKKHELNHFLFGGNFKLKPEIISLFNNTEQFIIDSYDEFVGYKDNRRYKGAVSAITKQINKEIGDSFYSLKFKNLKKESENICMLTLSGNLSDYVFFVKKDTIEFCKDYKTKYRRFDKIDEIDVGNDRWYEDFEGGDIYTFIKNNVLEVIEKDDSTKRESETKRNNKLEEYGDIFGDLLNQEIVLIHQGRQSVPDGVRFKLLKGFNISDGYMRDTFLKEMMFLKKKNVDKYVFMIPRYHSYFNNLGFGTYVRVGEFNRILVEHFELCGFTNVSFIE